MRLAKRHWKWLLVELGCLALPVLLLLSAVLHQMQLEQGGMDVYRISPLTDIGLFLLFVCVFLLSLVNIGTFVLYLVKKNSLMLAVHVVQTILSFGVTVIAIFFNAPLFLSIT